MNYLPSKNFILTVGIGVGVVFLGYGVWRISQGVFSTNTKTASSQKMRELDRAYTRFSQDTDNDGLKDWEENLWNTDPKNPDSDSDGTYDGDEVKQGRDPKKPGPDDKLSQEQIASSEQKSKTLTEELAHNIDIRYFLEKGFSNNQPLSEDQKNNIASSLLSDIGKELSMYGNAYSEKDINISQSTSMREYGNKLGGFISNTFNGLSGYELQIVDRASKSGNMTILKQLDPYIAGYAKVIEFMKQQPVPPAMTQGHLIFINSLNNLKIADEKMKLLETDGASALVGAKLFSREVPQMVNFLRMLRVELGRANTTFSASEPGAIFYKYFELQLKDN
jgi:hypothetical protein